MVAYYAAALPVMVQSSFTGVVPLSSYGTSVKGAKGSASVKGAKGAPPAPALLSAPKSPTAPPPPSRHPVAGPHTPAPCWTPGLARARSAPLLRSSSTTALAVTTAQTAERPYIHLGRSGF